MRRIVFVPLLLMVAMAATACPAAAPPGWSPPRVTSIVVDSPVMTGTAFTVTVTADDNIGVTGIALTFDSPAEIEPDPTELAAMVTCDEQSFAPATSITVVYSCSTTPLALPGMWIVTAAVGDVEGSGGFPPTGSAAFDVVAG